MTTYQLTYGINRQTRAEYLHPMKVRLRDEFTVPAQVDGPNGHINRPAHAPYTVECDGFGRVVDCNCLDSHYRQIECKHELSVENKISRNHYVFSNDTLRVQTRGSAIGTRTRNRSFRYPATKFKLKF